MRENRLPRGIRNRNPGNIRRTSIRWQGLSPLQDDIAFCTFDDAVYGMRAMMKVLLTYYRKYKLNTVEGIIHRWAPPVENNTSAYARHVARKLGVAVDEKIDVENADTLVRLAQNITLHENGPPRHGERWYSDEQYIRAAELALNINIA